MSEDLSVAKESRELHKREENHRKKLLRLANAKPDDLSIIELKKKRERMLNEHFTNYNELDEEKKKQIKEDNEAFFEKLRNLKPEENKKLRF
jgi:cytidylate kinase